MDELSSGQLPANRIAPVWDKETAEWFKGFGRCMVCGEMMNLGERYWLNSADMIAEPQRVFHNRCTALPLPNPLTYREVSAMSDLPIARAP